MGARGQHQVVLGARDSDEEGASFVVRASKEGFGLDSHDDDAVELKALTFMNAEDSYRLDFAERSEKLHKLSRRSAGLRELVCVIGN
jgi:hypothetical protein